jgi:hypothetical protein
MTAILLLVALVGALFLLHSYRNWLWKSRWERCLAQAATILAQVKAQYPGCEGALNLDSTTSNPPAMTDRIQTLYNSKLLRKIEPMLKLCQYGLDRAYKTIGTTIRFYRPRRANLSGINAETVSLSIVPLVTPTAITEGTSPTTLTTVRIGYVEISLGQRMGKSVITDKMQAIDLLNTSELYTDALAGDCALDYDTVARNALINGVYNSDNNYSNATLAANDGGYFERFGGIVNSGNSLNDFNALSAAPTVNGRFTRAGALGCVTQLKTSKIPKIGGRYGCIAPPQIVHDIRLDTVWTQSAVFNGNALWRDQQLEIDGVVYVEANNPWVESGTYGTESTTDAGTGLIYTTLFIGDESFGLPTLSNKRAGGSQQAPSIEILNKADKSDSHNQTTVFAWKSMFGCGPFIAKGYNASATANTIGDVPRYVAMRNKSTFA